MRWFLFCGEGFFEVCTFGEVPWEVTQVAAEVAKVPFVALLVVTQGRGSSSHLSSEAGLTGESATAE